MIDLKKEGITDYGTLKPVGFARSYQIAPMELFINNEPCQLSRFPNDSTILITDLINAGKFPRNEETIARGGTIKYNDVFPKNWKNLDNAWIEGYFHHGHAMDAVQVKEWNFENKSISTVHPHIYGFASGQPWNRFYAYNIPEELDQEKKYIYI
ncbi:MAG: hypothetical protein ACI94Y_002038 [Maribacter sp.]|jgi:hypothetical protein